MSVTRTHVRAEHQQQYATLLLLCVDTLLADDPVDVSLQTQHPSTISAYTCLGFRVQGIGYRV